ncbi:tRNA uracil 4-sulfurtransferase ThiI [Lacticaseibacillus sharpeae]|uniref:Probable tRNA sulfurtransferase n=1 Tax=Lacticaseibacillus sharpeae JCM 1186 = DSM 20505 TaxID=1291052 RepID=A0A0R1ZVP2_9LACO|nr:tRNA uracil 4-sulfurtransferase ThiI [Lacticaseibacillus sharpeae]KRM54892.1 thiamine biosynthesis protein ThiI [Lacticaseibacillus sharpeae JCM 1186 = DSM 20505]
MQYSEIMVRYGELSTKGKNQKAFIGRLNGNIAKTLHDFPGLTIRPKRDRTHIELNGTDATPIMDRLQKVFGIQSFSPSVQVEKDMDKVKAAALELVNATAANGVTFKVETKRADKTFPLDTNAMNLAMGDFLTVQRPDLVVKMKHPDVTLRVEIRREAIFLSTTTIKGAGGLPVGTAGKAAMMLSGGIDSPVAAYLALKRGVDIEMVHFFSPPYTSDNAMNKAKELTAKLTPYVGSITFIGVPFTHTQEEIKAKVPEGYLMTIQRRMMLRLTEAIAKQRGDLVIFNGESVGQVASQTLASMAAINDVSVMPIVRPVATMDKTEIIAQAEKIDTYELSIMPFEDCCTIFAPPAPKTQPRIDKARYYETKIDVQGLMDEALANLSIDVIRPGQEFLNQDQDIIADLL